ncbi:MAG: ribonuclease D [Acidobacteriota bacterium]
MAETELSLEPAEHPRYIESLDALETCCARWRDREALGVDTEFVRERTFYPQLGLIQISDGTTATLVDTLAIEDLAPLREVLFDPRIVKVLHSCSEDLEALFHRFGAFPSAVFDTQIAAAFCGLGYSIGYGRLVESLFAVQLPKDKTRTNWLRRPLSEDQKRYAAQDVLYLLPAFRNLQRTLEETGRTSWVEEELQALFDADRFLPAPDHAYLRLGASKTLPPRKLEALRRLAEWRELKARKRDLPRNFVLHDKTLVELARKLPRERNALRRIESLGRSAFQRHGTKLIDLIRSALAVPPSELPEAQPRARDLSPYRSQVQELRQEVKTIADRLGLPPELLATRKSVEKLARRFFDSRSPTLPPELRGWRQAVVGSRLIERLQSS